MPPMSIHPASCQLCKARKPGWFCSLSPPAQATYDAIGTHKIVVSGTVLFTQGESPQNIFVMCAGRVKLSTASRSGKILLIKIAKPGDVLGLSAALAERPYEVTAQARRDTGTLARLSGPMKSFLLQTSVGHTADQ
jgi:CRP/FNR family cyclic AMP-dependent transcriptional regulator